MGINYCEAIVETVYINNMFFNNDLNWYVIYRFATVSASCGVFSGKWMYELHLVTNGIMQLGWCTNLCSFSIDRGCGKYYKLYLNSFLSL